MKLFGAGKPDHPMAERKDAARLLGELPAQDLKALEEMDRQDKADVAAYRRAMARVKKGKEKLIPWSEAKKTLGL